MSAYGSWKHAGRNADIVLRHNDLHMAADGLPPPSVKRPMGEPFNGPVVCRICRKPVDGNVHRTCTSCLDEIRDLATQGVELFSKKTDAASGVQK